MTKSSPVHPSSDVTLARLAKLLVVTLLLLSPVYATALIVYGEKTNSFRVISPARKLIILLGPERRPVDQDLSIFFQHNCSDLSLSAQGQLIQFAPQLMFHKNLNIQVEGHCDRRGTKAYNRSLGRKRANVVKDFLIVRGLSGDRIETLSFGEERPLAEGSSETIWSKNRRATIRLSRPGRNQGAHLVEH